VLVVHVTVLQAVDIEIAYVFGSFEYNSWIQDADAFGLFHNGVNIALIGNDPVSLSTVNCNPFYPLRNCAQFIDNPNWKRTSLTGYTKTQVATLKLAAKRNQKVKIAVADAQNEGLDTAMFASFLAMKSIV
jgi:hypothetical protein